MEAFLTATIQKELNSASGPMLLDAQFTINKGEMVALYGPSGSGKSTILRIIAGLTKPSSGKITLENSLLSCTETRLFQKPQDRPIGFMFQDYALFPNMTLRENIEFAQPKRNINELDYLLELFDLGALQHHKPLQLSGGQRQRLALARTLAKKPQLLLLDEPLSAVDPTIRHRLQDELLTLQKSQAITTLLVTHDLPEVFRLAQRVLILESGKIQKSGSPFDVFGDARISGKVQLMAEVVAVETEDVIVILTVLAGNTPMKVAVCKDETTYQPGDKVLVVSKAFNPIVRKIE